MVLYDCSVGHGDCSRCQTAMPQYGCVWCEGEHPRCVAREACHEAETVATQCPAPLIHSVCWNAGVSPPLLLPLEGGLSCIALDHRGRQCPCPGIGGATDWTYRWRHPCHHQGLQPGPAGAGCAGHGQSGWSALCCRCWGIRGLQQVSRLGPTWEGAVARWLPVQGLLPLFVCIPFSRL